MALSRIQRAEIADDAINSAKIEDGTVLAADVIAGQITNAKISSGAGDKIASSKIAVGTVAALNVGTGANQILQFNNTPALPAVDGSLLTNLTADNLINALPALDGSNLTGITTDFSPITNQQARLGLHIASLETLVKYDIIDQVIDNYEDATGVESTIIAANNDLANGTNADYNNYTFRQIIPASVFSSNQTKIQIKFRAGNVYPNHFVNTYVGHKASSGNAWDYESAPTRITWGGGNNQTNIGNGTTATSDVITFALDSSKDLILAIDFSSGGNQQGVNYKAVGSTGWTGYAKGNYSGDSSNGAVATAPSGYSADNNIYGFDQIIFPGKITRVHGTSLAWS